MGEQVAVDYLLSKGYKIEARNWRSGRFEIDIVARHDGVIVVVEVKSRISDEYAEPEATVTRRQMSRLVEAYKNYAHQLNYDGECRFDVIGILFIDRHEPIINHIEDAFFPG